MWADLKSSVKLLFGKGRGGGQVVSVLALYSNNPSSNPTDANSFFSVKFMTEKNENKLKEARVGPLKI